MVSVTMTTTASTPSFNPGGAQPPLAVSCVRLIHPLGPKSTQLVDMSVEQIQHAAESSTPARLRGASLPIVLASAHKLGESAITAEVAGDLKVALHRYIQVARSVGPSPLTLSFMLILSLFSILRYVINLPEFNAQKTTLLPQFSELMKVFTSISPSSCRRLRNHFI